MSSRQRVGAWAGSARCCRQVALAVFAGVMLAAGGVALAQAQEATCERAQLVAATTNVDLLLRDANGTLERARLAGLQAWPHGWPLEEALPERLAAQVRGAGLCLTPAAVERAADGVRLWTVWLPGARGALAEVLVEQGWAEVAPDAERTVPELAAALRQAEARARENRRGLWEIRAWLTSYTAPNGRSIQVDRRAVPALEVLARLPEGRRLLDRLADAAVPIFMAPEPAERRSWAHYDLRGRVIWIDRSLIGSDPRNIAVVLAHEAQHAVDHADGLITAPRTSVADEEACFASEVRAFSLELGIWRTLFGASGSPVERSRFERQQNILLELVGDSEDELERRVRRVYRWNCRARPGEPSAHVFEVAPDPR